MTPPSPSYALIACDVFDEEIPVLARRLQDVPESEFQPPWQQIAWVEMGLHDRPAALRAQLQSLIDAWDSSPEFSCILLAFGLCGNSLVGIHARNKPLILPRAHDCISLLLGGCHAHESVLKESPGTYFYSPGWIRGRRVPGPDRENFLRELYQERYPDDPEMVADLIEIDAETFAHHSCAAYVDLTQNATAESYCQSCASHMGWNFRRLSGDASFLSRLLGGPWDNNDFLTVPPGFCTQQTSNESLIVAVPTTSAV